MHYKKGKYVATAIGLILGVFVLLSPKLGVAESAAGSVYSLEGGVVYQAGDLSGSTYSLSGSGDVVVGSSAGGSFSQNQGEFSGGSAAVPTVVTSGTASGNSIGVGYTAQSGGGNIGISAYSYYKKDLTLIVTFSNPKDAGSLVLVGKKEFSPLYFSALNGNTFLIRFSDVDQGVYTLSLGKPAYTVGAPLSLYSIDVNQEGNGLVNGPDSVASASVGDGTSQVPANTNQGITTSTSATNNSVIAPSKPKAVDIKPVATSTVVAKTGVACKLFGIKCAYLPPIYILIVCLIGYLMHKFVISKGKDNKVI